MSHFFNILQLLITFESIRLLFLITDKQLLKTVYFKYVEDKSVYSGQELEEIEMKVDKIYTPYYTYFCGEHRLPNRFSLSNSLRSSCCYSNGLFSKL